MKVETEKQPAEDGVYACRQYYGWRILEWYRGEWHHVGRGGKWPASAKLDAWVGPLPLTSVNYQPLKAPEPAGWEYDL